jgi:hypothetical protein
MASRPKPIPTPHLSPTRSARKSLSNRTRPIDRMTRRWRRDVRPTAVRTAVSATKALQWTRPLIEATLEELYVDDHFEELVGRAPGDLRPGQYAQAIAVALILRHSWHPDDLACMLRRLKLRVGD